MPIIDGTYRMLLLNTGEATISPSSANHNREGLLAILEDETPVRIGLALNMTQESLGDRND